MKVFSLAKFYYDLRECDISFKSIKCSMSWANKCHGQPVVNGMMKSTDGTKYGCIDRWTNEVAEND